MRIRSMATPLMQSALGILGGKAVARNGVTVWQRAQQTVKQAGLGLLVALAACQTALAGPEEAFVERTHTRFASLRAAPKEARPAGCKALYSAAFDTAAVAAGAARKEWKRMKASRQAAMVQSTGQRLVRECLSVLARPEPGPPVILKRAQLGSGLKVTVQHIGPQGKDTIVTWTLKPGGPFGMRALDATAEGRGLVASLRSEFDGALAATGGNIDKAIVAFAGKR